MRAGNLLGRAGGPLKQTTFSSLAWSDKKKTTHREAFLTEMEPVIPWERFTRLIEPVYPKAEAGCQPSTIIVHATIIVAPSSTKQGIRYRVNRRGSEQREIEPKQVDFASFPARRAPSGTFLGHFGRDIA